MEVDRKDDNVNDIISISKPPREEVDIYANDKNTNTSYEQSYLWKVFNRFSTSYLIEIE